MEKTTNEKLDWHTGNPFFDNKNGYDGFVVAMLTAAAENRLPLAYDYDAAENVTMQDIKEFSLKFMQDTGLHIEFDLVTCRYCDRLHCCIIVDEFPNDESKNYKESEDNDWNEKDC